MFRLHRVNELTGMSVPRKSAVGQTFLSVRPEEEPEPALSDAHMRNRDDEFATVITVLLLLSEDFIGEVPGQQQTVVGLVGQ